MATERTKKTQFNFSRWPTPPLADTAVLERIVAAGWRDRTSACTTLAVFIAESRLVQYAYLARVKLPPGEYFLVERTNNDPRTDTTVYRTPGYEQIRARTARWPQDLRLSEARRRFKAIGCEIVSADRCVPQNNEDYDPVPDRRAFTLKHAIGKARDTYVRWDNTWNAWMTYRSGHHKPHLPRAAHAWRQLYGSRARV